MQAGDVIIRVNQQPVRTWSDAIPLLAEMGGQGSITVNRNGSEVVLTLEAVTSGRTDTGILFFPERLAVENPGGNYSDVQSQGGVVVGVIAPTTAKNSTLVTFIFMVMNHTDRSVTVLPEHVLVMDGLNSILHLLSAKALAISAAQSAQAQYQAYDQYSNTQVAAAAMQPPSYNITGHSSTTGYGTINSYSGGYGSTYGNYNYTGATNSNYQLAPQPNYSLAGAQLGRALGLAVARHRLEKNMRTADLIYSHEFEFGEIPPGTTRRGAVICQAPEIYPFRIRATIDGNEYTFEFLKAAKSE